MLPVLSLLLMPLLSLRFLPLPLNLKEDVFLSSSPEVADELESKSSPARFKPARFRFFLEGPSIDNLRCCRCSFSSFGESFASWHV